MSCIESFLIVFVDLLDYFRVFSMTGFFSLLYHMHLIKLAVVLLQADVKTCFFCLTSGCIAVSLIFPLYRLKSFLLLCRSQNMLVHCQNFISAFKGRLTDMWENVLLSSVMPFAVFVGLLQLDNLCVT